MQTKSNNIFLIIFLLLVGFAGVGLGVYFWTDNRSLQEENDVLRTEIPQNTSQGSTEETLSLQSGQPGTENDPSIITLSQEIITGQALRQSSDDDVVIECFILPGTLQTIWVQYGNTLLPQEQTAGVADGLDEGEEGMYAPVGVRIPVAEIENNALYSYQCLGVNDQDHIRNGGVASFNAR